MGISLCSGVGFTHLVPMLHEAAMMHSKSTPTAITAPGDQPNRCVIRTVGARHCTGARRKKGNPGQQGRFEILT